MLRNRISLLLILAILLSLALPVLAAGTPTVRIEAPETVKAGETFEVRVVLDNNPGICAAQFTLQFDHAALSCESAEVGELLRGMLSATNAKGDAGAIIAAASATPATGDGTLGVFRFKAVKDGAPAFGMTEGELADADAKVLTASYPAALSEKQPESGESAPQFLDTAGHFASDFIERAADLGLIYGYEGLYRPDDAMTRGECVTILYRAMGSPKVERPATFTDLTHNYYRDAVAWAEQNGIVNGVGGGKFNPTGQVTRAQLAAILYRLAGGQSGTELMFTGVYDSQYADSAEIPGWAKSAVYWAVYNEIYCGTDRLEIGASLAPNRAATRAQIAVMIVRYLDKFT